MVILRVAAAIISTPAIVDEPITFTPPISTLPVNVVVPTTFAVGSLTLLSSFPIATFSGVDSSATTGFVKEAGAHIPCAFGACESGQLTLH
jgi:hypothetical protein